MKESLRSILLPIIAGLFVWQMTACKAKEPELTGKWTGSGNLATQISKAPGKYEAPETRVVPIQITLTLDQNGSGLTGDAAVTFAGKPAVHLPITAGVVDQSGTISLEADRSGFSNVHLSVSGKASATQISGDVALRMDTLLGVAENKGPITLTRAG